jgi:hypothetical protein
VSIGGRYNPSMPNFSPSQRRAADALAIDLEEVFGRRLQALVAYSGSHGDGAVHSCAVVDGLSFQDLTRCLPFTDRWRQRRIAVPLMLSQDELQRTLDIFPLEYATIAADHLVVRGKDPFAGMAIPVEDVRRATEAQAKSHLIHLREAYLESHGETTRIAEVIAASAAPLRALLRNISRLHGMDAAGMSDEALAAMADTRMGAAAPVIRDVLAASADGPSAVTDPGHLLARYVEATERIWAFVDTWLA